LIQQFLIASVTPIDFADSPKLKPHADTTPAAQVVAEEQVVNVDDGSCHRCPLCSHPLQAKRSRRRKRKRSESFLQPSAKQVNISVKIFCLYNAKIDECNAEQPDLSHFIP
jgi:hypothetical protein